MTFGLKPGEKRKFEEVTSDVIMVMRTTLSKKEFASALGMKEGDLFYFHSFFLRRGHFESADFSMTKSKNKAD